jgi:hypothetical protein
MAFASRGLDRSESVEAVRGRAYPIAITKYAMASTIRHKDSFEPDARVKYVTAIMRYGIRHTERSASMIFMTTSPHSYVARRLAADVDGALVAAFCTSIHCGFRRKQAE